VLCNLNPKMEKQGLSDQVAADARLICDECQPAREDAMIAPISSFPVFIVEDLDAAKSFYTAHFAFDIAFENAWYLHLISASGIQVGFMLPNQPTQPAMFHKGHDGSGVIFSLEVDDADSAHAEAKKHSLDIVLELRAEDWGQYHFCLRDPNGIYLDIVQETEATEEYQQDYVI
jgi:catechol 2,3-dioxygenase-like lactoylglutathione lyase family enzyme